MKDEFDYEFFVLFYTDDGISICVYHMVGFEEFPNNHDIKMLIEELKTDEELGMTTLVKLCKIKVVDKQMAFDIMKEDYSTWG